MDDISGPLQAASVHYFPETPASNVQPGKAHGSSSQAVTQPPQQIGAGKEDQAEAAREAAELILPDLALSELKLHPTIAAPHAVPKPPQQMLIEKVHQASAAAEESLPLKIAPDVDLPSSPREGRAAPKIPQRLGPGTKDQAKAVHEQSQVALIEMDSSEIEPPYVPSGRQLASGKENQITAVQELFELMPSRTALPEIEPPYMPPSPPVIPRPSTSSRVQENNVFGWEGHAVGRGRAGALIDLSAPEDQLRDSSNTDPRNLKRTMDQKAPCRKLVGGNLALIKKFEEASRQLLALALTRQGPITFEVGIGRLLVNHQIGSNEFKAKPFNVSEWSSAFSMKNDRDKLETIFTPRLTTSLLDIDFILDTRLPQRRRLLDRDPVLRNVTYILVCRATQGEMITVKIDENGMFRILGPEVLIGRLDFHFPKRAWDASLCLKTEGLCTSTYQRHVDAIIRNMKIEPRDGTTLDLSTQTIDQELIIESIILRRNTAHKSKVYVDLLLHVCEVQDLNVSRMDNQYHGTIREPKEMVNANRIWWEASITSISAGDVLSENDLLEFGETAKWSPHTIINNGAVRDMYSLAHEIVTNIDNVGYFNKGAKVSSGSRGQTTSYQTGSRNQAGIEEGAYW